MSDTTDPNSQKRGTGYNGWWFASAAVIVAVLLAAGAVIVFGGPGDTSTPQATATPGAAPGTSTQPVATSGEGRPGCHPSATDQTVPSAAPSDLQWEVVDSIALPWSSTAGALHRDRGVWTCYAHTPTGALLAATFLSSAESYTQAARVLQEQAISGPNRDAKLAEVRKNPPQSPEPGTTADIAGFKFLDYTPQRATIQIAAAFANRYLVVTVPVVWSGGDWKLNMDPPGGPVPGAPLASLEGYTRLGAP